MPTIAPHPYLLVCFLPSEGEEGSPYACEGQIAEVLESMMVYRVSLKTYIAQMEFFWGRGRGGEGSSSPLPPNPE